MAIYDDLRVKIELLGGGAGPKGSFNHKGGKEIVIKYNTGSGLEDHHVVPYLIGLSPNSSGSGNVEMLLAYKYAGDPAHPGLGFRCYKVNKISAIAAVTVARPSALPKVKLKRQSCVDDW